MRVLAWTVLPFGGAIFAALWLLPEQQVLWLVLGIAAVCLGVVLLLRRSDRKRLRLAAIGFGIGLLWCSAFTGLVVIPLNHLDGNSCLAQAVVTAQPWQNDYSVTVMLRVDTGTQRPFDAVTYLDSAYADLTPGDTLSGTVSFYKQESGNYYQGRGIFLGCKMGHDLVVHRKERTPLWLVPAVAARKLRQSLGQLYDGEVLTFLTALVTGDKSGMDETLYGQLQRSGFAHVVAVSGLHVAFLVELVMLLPGNRRKKAVLCIPVLAAFALLTGGSPSVVRAVVMESLLLLAPVLDRDYDGITAFAFALGVLLAANPYSAYSVSMILSFGAMAGILWLPSRLMAMTRPHLPEQVFLRKAAYGVLSVLYMSLGAMVFILPLAMLLFQQYSLLAPLTSVLLLWLMPFVFGGGLVSAVLGLWSIKAAAVLAIPIRLGAEFVLMVCTWIGNLPVGVFSTGSVYFMLWIGVLYAVAGLLWLCPNMRKRWYGWSAGLVGLLALMVLLQQADDTEAALTAAVLDVGQGQSIALISGGCAAAVDCGGADGAGDVLADYLVEAGVEELDYLLLTHFDSDHVNGVPQLMRRTRVCALLLPDMEDDSGNRERIVSAAEQEGCAILWVTEDVTLSVGKAALRVFAPVHTHGSDNETGLSLLASGGAMDLLVTGDMDTAAEERLLSRERLPQIEVLIAGHHGSSYATGTVLLQAVTPRLAVISVGNNPYGHPTAETLERLTAAECRIYRTDKNGTVMIRSED